MNYKILNNEDELLRFIKTVLPSCKENEQFYVSLLARGKWKTENMDNSEIFSNSSKIQLKRFSSSADRLVDKIKQLECEVGSYKYEGKAIPNEILGLYIMPNPRDLYLASMYLQKQIVDNQINKIYHQNPHQMALTEIQKRCGNKKYFDVDVDIISTRYKYDVLEAIKPILNEIGVYNDGQNHIIETVGGFHILINLNSDTLAKNWYQILSAIKIDGTTIDMKGDNLLPIPGCIQGGIIPKII